MLSDDVLYVLLLLASIGWGVVTTHPFWNSFGAGPAQVRHIRKFLSSLFGLGIVILVSGKHTLHPIISVVVQYVLIRTVNWRSVHLVSFVLGFAHLFIFRTCGYFQWLPPAPPAHTNAIQMILTLKLMGVAFEVHDSQRLKVEKGQESNKADDLETKYRTIASSPGLLDLFHYAFAHSGVLTGPYYRYRTFEDMHRGSWSPRVDRVSAALSRLSTVPIYVVLFLASGAIFPLDAVKSDDFYGENSPVWWRVFYMTPVFFNFRMRLFSGFVLSECSCIMAGLGAYPSASDPKPGLGPSNLAALDVAEKDPESRINFETMHNIDEYRVESVTTMREALKTWNMTVQWWLAANVYKRLPSTVPRPLRTVAVMVISSAWHGVYAGYYLSLGSVPFVLPVEDLYENILRKRLVEHQKHELVRAYDSVAWFMRFQWFSYLGMGFQLLRVDYTIRFWHSIGYLGHLILPVFYIIGLTVVNPLVNSLFPRMRRE